MKMQMKALTRHVLGLSGGKDSSALAIYMRDHQPDIHTKMEYYFCDTGSELPEVYAFLEKLEDYLGKPIIKLQAEGGFLGVLKDKGNFLPSYNTRWCTELLKIKPFDKFVGEDKVISYIGIRHDENRKGYISKKKNIETVYPFIDAKLVREDIFAILEHSIGIPEYYRWRSRSGCYFCFFQRQSEWLGLKREHPLLFKKSVAIEKKSKFNWNSGGTLDEVVAKAQAREDKKKQTANQISLDWKERIKEEDENNPACPVCHL